MRRIADLIFALRDPLVRLAREPPGKGIVEGLHFGRAASVRRMRYGNPVGASCCMPPAVAPHARLVESVGHKRRRTRSPGARRLERQDHDQAIFLERHCPTIDRAQVPTALRPFADVELDGAFSRFVENDGDILWLGD